MKKYFLHINGYQQGPFSFEELRMMNISPQTPVWFAGMQAWMPASQLYELQSLFSYRQPHNYNQPANPFPQQPAQNPFNTSFHQPAQPQTNRTTMWILISAGGFLVLCGIGIFLFIKHKKDQQQMERERVEIAYDSMKMADSVMQAYTYDSITKADEMQRVADSTMAAMMADSLRMADSLANVQQNHYH